jgi:hypothetical protein
MLFESPPDRARVAGLAAMPKAIHSPWRMLTDHFITSKCNSIVMRLGAINQHVIKFLIFFLSPLRPGARVDAGGTLELDFVSQKRRNTGHCMKPFVIDFLCVLDADGEIHPRCNRSEIALTRVRHHPCESGSPARHARQGRANADSC